MPNVCGTGFGNFPQPGDPDLNGSILSAQSGFGGIAVSWTYPGLNPHAVAYTLLYRSTVNNFASAPLIQTVGGNYHFDQSNVVVGTGYYYWIKMVSVNGTIGEVIGPAYAVMQPTMEQIIDLLTDQVSNSLLNQALKTEIGRITDLTSAISDEEQARLFGENVLSQLMAAIQVDLDAIDTLVASETLERTTADSALVAQINLILAKANDNAAAILLEQVVRADEDSAIAFQVETLQVTLGDDIASVQTLQSAQGTVLDGLSAQWMVKTDVNGYVAGFGLYNDGVTSDFIIRADTFAIGQAGEADKFPFIIGSVNGVPQIVLNAATLIPDATIGNAMIGNYIQSDNYNPTTGVGWRIDKSGWANFNAITIRNAAGQVILSSGTGLEYSYVNGGPPANATNGAPSGTYVGTQLAQTVAASVAVVNDISADNILTPSEKFQLRREWDSLQKLYFQVRTNASSAGISVTALQNAYIALGTRLHNAAWAATTSTTPFHISDAQLGVNSTITGSSLRTEYQTFFTQYSALVASLHVGAPNGTFVGGQLAQTVASSVTVVNDMSADNVLTPTEKVVMRRNWDSLAAEYNAVRTAALYLSLSTTTLDNNIANIGTSLHGATWNAFLGTPALIADAALATNSTIDGSLLRSRWTTGIATMNDLWDTINRANVSAANKITSGNASTFISDLAVNTLQIANNAVTVPEGADLQPNVAVGTGMTSLGSKAVAWPSNGKPSSLLISAVGTFEGGTASAATLALDCLVDGAQREYVAISVAAGFSTQASIMIKVEGGNLGATGSTVQIRASSTQAGFTCRYLGIQILGAKK